MKILTFIWHAVWPALIGGLMGAIVAIAVIWTVVQ